MVPNDGGQTALNPVNEAPIGSPETVVASPGMAAPDREEAGEPRTRPSRRQPPGAGALGAVVGPVTRTGSYYAQSWRDYLDGQPHELPIARPTIALAVHALRDEIVLLGLRARRPVSDVHEFDRINREVVAALDFYGRRGWLDKPEGFFASPPPLTDVTIRQVKGRRRSHERIVFDSGYKPYPGEPGRKRWLSYTRQRPRVRIDAAPQGASTVAGVCARRGDGPGRPRSHVVPGVAPARGSGPQCRVARPSDAWAAGTGAAERRGVSRART